MIARTKFAALMRCFRLSSLGILVAMFVVGQFGIGQAHALAIVPPRTTTIRLLNSTTSTLRLTNYGLDHGDWTPKLKPPAEIKPGETRYWKSESAGILSATSGPKGHVRYSLDSAAWHPPFTISRPNTTRAGSSLLSISRNPEQEDVFYVTPDGAIDSVWWSQKENKWSAPYRVAPAGAARADSTFAGFCRAPGYMDIFWITPKGEISTKTFVNNKWSAPINLTGPDVAHRQTDLAAITRHKDSIDVFWIGKSSTISSVSWSKGAWTKPINLAPANSARDGSSLTAITRTKDEIHVYFANKDGAIASIWWRGKWNGPGPVTGKSTVADGSSIAAVAMDPKHLAVFWVNKEGAVSTTYSLSNQNGGKWNAPYALSAAKGAKLRSPISAYNRTSTHMDVFWLSPEGAVMTTYFQSGGQWGKAFAISAAGAARADSSFTALSRVNNHVDVFWIDGKGSVATNWWDEKSVDSIYISWTNPFVDSVYGNTYHEQAPLNYSLSYTGGKGSHAEANYVLEKSTKHVVKGFSRAKHGFKFSNSDWKDKGIKLPVVKIDFPKPFGTIDITNSTQGLCGGMVYSVIDYFNAGQAIPTTKVAPSTESDPLFKYLKERLISSFDVTGTGPNYIKYMRHDYPDADEGVVQGLGLMKGRSYIIAREEWPKVKADIDANRLSPLGLVQIISYNPGDIGKNHQVLAYGYLLSGPNVTIYYYDPNNPNDDFELRFKIGDLSKRIDILRFKNGSYSAKTINTFFRSSYRPAPASLIRPK